MSTSFENPVTRAYWRYCVEFCISMAAYAGVLIGTRWLLHGPLAQAPAEWRVLVAAVPVLPLCFLFAAIVRVVRGTDEFHRRILIESLALAGGATALLAATYGLIEGDGLPRLSAWWAYGTFMAAWIVATFFVRRRYR